jgi:hypothetical protein
MVVGAGELALFVLLKVSTLHHESSVSRRVEQGELDAV